MFSLVKIAVASAIGAAAIVTTMEHWSKRNAAPAPRVSMEQSGDAGTLAAPALQTRPAVRVIDLGTRRPA